MRKSLLTLLLAVGFVAPIQAQVVVEDAWTRATVAQQRATGVFMSLTAKVPTRVVGVSSPAAEVVELHEMRMDGEVMKMRAVEALDLRPGEKFVFAPGGHHVMLIGLTEQVREGAVIPVSLTIEDEAGERHVIAFTATARALTHSHGHAHGD